MEVEEHDREKTGFTAGNGLWQFSAMAFGLCNASTTFEQLMDNILGDVRTPLWMPAMVVLVPFCIQLTKGYKSAIAYYSQALSKLNRNFRTTRCERLAIARAIDHFHP